MQVTMYNGVYFCSAGVYDGVSIQIYICSFDNEKLIQEEKASVVCKRSYPISNLFPLSLLKSFTLVSETVALQCISLRLLPIITKSYIF